MSEEHTVVIVVDELDRCQPDYAIKTLERLHHLFCDLENIIVILSIDGKRFVKGIFAKVIFGANQKTKGLVIYSNNKPFRILK